jgi:hypothetical protein
MASAVNRIGTLAIVVLLVALVGATESYASSPHRRPTKHPARAEPSVIAYGLVLPICGTCEPPNGYSPLVAKDSRHVSLGGRGTYNTGGVWCFPVHPEAPPPSPTVVASPVGLETKAFLRKNTTVPLGATGLSTAQWIPAGEGCARSQIEIRTLRFYAAPTGLILESSEEIAFSFVVLGRSRT